MESMPGVFILDSISVTSDVLGQPWEVLRCRRIKDIHGVHYRQLRPQVSTWGTFSTAASGLHVCYPGSACLRVVP